jgi:hypothetical protein
MQLFDLVQLNYRDVIFAMIEKYLNICLLLCDILIIQDVHNEAFNQDICLLFVLFK